MTAHNGNGGLAARQHFGDRLTDAVAQRQSQIVLGIDPDPAKLWPAALESTSEARAHLASTLSEAVDAAGGIGDSGPSAAGVVARLESAAAVLAHARALIDAAGPACVAVKPQLACFERLGAPGWLALEQVCEHARAGGLLVLADGKRGDVPVTAAAYGQALVASTPSPFGPVAGLGADAFTANPLLGRDALLPLIETAREHAAGTYVLVRTSNPGAADVLDLELADGERLWERLARMVAELGETGRCGLADVGAVTGATEPQHLARLRELMPHHAVPAARHRCAGRRHRRTGPGVRSRAGRRARHGVAIDRQRAPVSRRFARRGRPRRGRASA